MVENLVTITVDGRALQVPKGTLLWEACKAHGIDIPIFCYHTKLGPVGACRTCLVEQEGVTKGPVTACSTAVADGMKFHTRTATVQKAQAAIFEFLLANHPLDCPICDRGGECPLQDQTMSYGPGTSRYIEPKRHHVKPIVLGPTIALDRERCVLCWRCVRFCAEVAEDKSIVLLDRGDHTIVGTFQDRPYVSNFSGNVVELCPVGALTSRKQRFNFRPWELQNRPSICPHCPMGCNINVSVRKNDEVIRFLSRDNPEIDNSWLCDRGRFNFEFINSPERLHSPMIRRDDAFVQTSWNEALTLVAERLRWIVETHGAESVVGIASPRLTNEDLYVFKRFMTDVIGTPNVDHAPRSTMVLTPAQVSAYQELDDTVTSIAALNDARTIILLGADPSQRAPVLELRIREAVNRHGARLVSVQSADIPLTSKASRVLATNPATFAQRISALAAELSAEAATPNDELGSLAADFLHEGPFVVVYDDAFAGITDKGDALTAVAALVAALARRGQVGTLPMLDDCNSMGARDLRVFPQQDPHAFWAAPLTGRLQGGRLAPRAAIIAGANIVRDLGPEIAGYLENMDLVVVLELMATETVRHAHVVLPAASFAEKTGTFTNLERRVQMVTPTVPTPGIARPDWEILVDLSQSFDRPLEYATPEEIWEDIRRDTAHYQGLSYLDIGPRGTRPQALQLV
jgi:NADH-quinone oxidoreductase subunit G